MVRFLVRRGLPPPRLDAENGSESALVGKSLLRLFVHPVNAFQVSVRLGLFFAKIDSEAFRAAVGLFLDVRPLSATCSKWKIWPKKIERFFWPNLIENETRKKSPISTAARKP